ncbi:sialidase-1 [Streptomyces indicus]|uniref:exo-alpha-sialidase n=1 Tax=Streptomyces indicus TaxID=417292 RepID=A0A1G8WH67_9ACTN|nr:sialidase-1 [Streptomyces indicus]
MSRASFSPRTSVAAAAAGAFALITASILTSADRADPAPKARRTCTSSIAYTSGIGGYATYRIPAIVQTREGALLAFAEGRTDGAGDSGNIDVVLRRSHDGGCTWERLQVVAAGNGHTRGNPAPVIDPRTGRVVLVTSYNAGNVTETQILRGETTAEQSRRVFVQTSYDDGRTFSRPREITSAVKRPNWRWYATGPGHAIALTSGVHAGRLVVPANHSTAPPPGSPDSGQEPHYYGAHAIYSDDGGLTWQLGFTDDSHEGANNPNKSTAAQLPDGRIYFNARDQNGTSQGNRLDTYSSDGSTAERAYRTQPTLDDAPVVQGSTLQLRGEHGKLLFSGPSEPNDRVAMAIWSSSDAGRTFTKELVLSPKKAAYSTSSSPTPERSASSTRPARPHPTKPSSSAASHCKH